MDGGILQVPFEQLDEFYTEYVHSVRIGTKLYIVEQKTDIFCFFVDLDYKSEKALPEDAILELACTMNSVVNKGRCIIARAEPRKVGSQIKTGVHFHWPDAHVTKVDAIALRTRILLELPDDPEWSDRIDASVYGGSGLRMLWSHKRDAGPYTPWIDLETRSTFSKIPDKDILSLFTVRTNKTDRSTMNVEITCAPLERFIRRNMKGQETANVRRVMRKGNDNIVVQTDSRFCERIQGEHKSNHVWFGIRGELICQLCHDEECKKFVGREHILSPSIVAELRSNVAVDNSTYVSIRDLVPNFWWKEESLSAGSAPVLGSRRANVEVASAASRGLRKYKTTAR
jgi:hypothetical protein